MKPSRAVDGNRHVAVRPTVVDRLVDRRATLLIGKADRSAIRRRNGTVVRRGKRPVDAVDGGFALEVGPALRGGRLLAAAHKKPRLSKR